jgi:uncharacterized protein YjiK
LLCSTAGVPGRIATVTATFDIPLREVSGISLTTRKTGETVLVAIGDHSSVVASAELTDSSPGDWQLTDMARLAGLDATFSQAEGIAHDANGLVLMVFEEPARIAVVDPAQRRLVEVISLVVRGDDRVARGWAADPNSRGEGIVLLDGGHVLVVKEKKPPALIEFGPAGHDPGQRLLRPDEAWHPDGQPAVSFVALATWLLDTDLGDQLGDMSDAAVGPDGQLYVLSDQSHSIARLQWPVAGDTPVTALDVFEIAGAPDKPEGLAALPDGRLLVARDTRKPKGNLLVVELPD